MLPVVCVDWLIAIVKAKLLQRLLNLLLHLALIVPLNFGRESKLSGGEEGEVR